MQTHALGPPEAPDEPVTDMLERKNTRLADEISCSTQAEKHTLRVLAGHGGITETARDSLHFYSSQGCPFTSDQEGATTSQSFPLSLQ